MTLWGIMDTLPLNHPGKEVKQNKKDKKRNMYVKGSRLEVVANLVSCDRVMNV